LSDEFVGRGQNICLALSCKQAEKYQNPFHHPQFMTFCLLESTGSLILVK